MSHPRIFHEYTNNQPSIEYSGIRGAFIRGRQLRSNFLFRTLRTRRGGVGLLGGNELTANLREWGRIHANFLEGKNGMRM